MPSSVPPPQRAKADIGDEVNGGVLWPALERAPLFMAVRGGPGRSSQPLWLFSPRLTDREKRTSPRGVLGLISALGEPNLAGLQILNPKGPSAPPDPISGTAVLESGPAEILPPVVAITKPSARLCRLRLRAINLGNLRRRR
jgi:hypothetical protein